MNSRELSPHVIKMVERISLFSDVIRSMVLIGSHGTDDETEFSDIDILLLSHKPLSVAQASDLGSTLTRPLDSESNDIFLFFNPECERCHLASPHRAKIHLILHDWECLQGWLEARDYIVCGWSCNHMLVWGDGPFSEAVKPVPNRSILDRYDGLPGFISTIRSVLLTKCPSRDFYEYERYVRYFENRANELSKWFPNIAGNLSVDSTSTGRARLVGLGEYFARLESRLKKELPMSENV